MGGWGGGKGKDERLTSVYLLGYKVFFHVGDFMTE